MTDIDRAIAETAQRTGLGEEAVTTLFRALTAGRGTQAQFSHPELGGLGQWSGGMIQIGDMFNTALKARVAAACADLAHLAAGADDGHASASYQSQWQGVGGSFGLPGSVVASRGAWWPSVLGQPASTGAQDHTRYACFPDRQRLVVERDGRTKIYDTGPHRITGFSQQQSAASDMVFTSQLGPVALDDLTVVESYRMTHGEP